MNKYFEKGKRILIKKGYKTFEEYPLVIHFYKRYYEQIRQEIWFDVMTQEFYGGTNHWAILIREQEELDILQLAFNNLQADLKELKEIKND